MTNENPSRPLAVVSIQILTDIHFWIPIAVLLAGLAVLHWMQ